MAETPLVFIASSREAIPVAEAVNVRLEHDARIKQWDNAFDLSSFTLPTLVARTKEADFAIFVFHKDDQTIIRGKEYSSVRDNVVFELGLFIGSLGVEKCFVLVPKSVEHDFRLPTDLAGLTVTAYDDTIEDMVDAVTTSCAKIKQSIKRQSNPANETLAAATSVDPMRELQSDLWRTRIDLDQAKEQAIRMQSAIVTYFYGLAKPATEIEIARWEEGAKGSYTAVPKIGGRNTFYVDRDVIIPSLYGANSISVIVAPGVKVSGLDQWSHNSVYFMDGFRKAG